MASPESQGDSAPDPADTGHADPGHADIQAMSFEQALAELEGIVQELERGQLELEAAIDAYTRGTMLKQHCAGKLREAQMRVERITLGEDGRARAEPADLGG
jgi:exodeoxyribonuclease VII small subunit